MLRPSSLPSFLGFEDPSANYYRLPNSWFDIMRHLREASSSRIIGAVKLLEYVLKHTWGYQRFEGQIRLTADEICRGRQFRGRRLDQGTGLSENSVRKAADNLTHFGALEVIRKNDAARRIRTFRPRMRLEESWPQPVNAGDFDGFDRPETNYFKVPNVWTDIVRSVQSAATILVVEYFFRHAWGYHNAQGVWLDPEQIAHGRLYGNGRRYDQGVAYDVATVYRAVQEAVELKLLVWVEKDEAGSRKRFYNLRWRGGAVDGGGQYIGPVPHDYDEAGQPMNGGSRNIEEAIRNVEDENRKVEGRPGDNVEVMIGNVEEVIRKVEGEICDREDEVCKPEARTASPYTLKDTLDSHSDTPATETGDSITVDSPLFAVVAGGQEFLRDLGIENPARRQILKKTLPPEVVMAWTLYAWAQDALDRNKAGFLIKRLLSDEDNRRPPERFLAFADLTWGDWGELWRLIEPYSQKDIYDLPEALRPIAPLWLQVYYPRRSGILPAGILEKLEAVLSATYDESEANDGRDD